MTYPRHMPTAATNPALAELVAAIEKHVNRTAGTLTATEIKAEMRIDATQATQFAIAMRLLREHSRVVVQRVGNASHYRYASVLYSPPAEAPAPRTPPRTIDRLAGTYLPAQWTNEIARPEGENHKRYGSLQRNGSVAPYRTPILNASRN